MEVVVSGIDSGDLLCVDHLGATRRRRLKFDEQWSLLQTKTDKKLHVKRMITKTAMPADNNENSNNSDISDNSERGEGHLARAAHQCACSFQLGFYCSIQTEGNLKVAN